MQPVLFALKANGADDPVLIKVGDYGARFHGV
jgi:hypothetical protein